MWALTLDTWGQGGASLNMSSEGLSCRVSLGGYGYEEARGGEWEEAWGENDEDEGKRMRRRDLLLSRGLINKVKAWE